jgi:hypothetical protein
VTLGRKDQMSTLTLVVDDRELSTIRAALLLLQEQVDMLPEDLAEMVREHGPVMTGAEIGQLSSRLLEQQEQPRGRFEDRSRIKSLVEIDRLSHPTFLSKQGNGLLP